MSTIDPSRADMSNLLSVSGPAPSRPRVKTCVLLRCDSLRRCTLPPAVAHRQPGVVPLAARRAARSYGTAEASAEGHENATAEGIA